ncbi:hypothetical protein OPAG_05259 [Rhodococcus opacus PD630]|nr:hypothetical protein OPAG_05259 [Rhodococcus opacus PD630]
MTPQPRNRASRFTGCPFAPLTSGANGRPAPDVRRHSAATSRSTFAEPFPHASSRRESS